jgi:hypothetical protein
MPTARKNSPDTISLVYESIAPNHSNSEPKQQKNLRSPVPGSGDSLRRYYIWKPFLLTGPTLQVLVVRGRWNYINPGCPFLKILLLRRYTFSPHLEQPTTTKRVCQDAHWEHLRYYGYCRHRWWPFWIRYLIPECYVSCFNIIPSRGFMIYTPF